VSKLNLSLYTPTDQVRFPDPSGEVLVQNPPQEIAQNIAQFQILSNWYFGWVPLKIHSPHKFSRISHPQSHQASSAKKTPPRVHDQSKRLPRCPPSRSTRDSYTPGRITPSHRDKHKLFGKRQSVNTFREEPRPNMLFCVATHPHPFLLEWERSARKEGWDPHVLGMGTKWEGFSTKTQLLLGALKHLPREQPVLITDAYDLLLTGSPDRLQVQDKIIIGAERRKGPNALRVPHSREFYPNMGFVAGKAGILRRMYTRLLKICPHDDQLAVSQYMRQEPHLFLLDVHSKWVLNLNYSWQVPQKITTLAVHVPFLHLDLGWRVNQILKKLNRPPISRGESLLFLLKHLWREAFNPVFRGLSLSFLLNLLLLPHAGRRWRAGETPWGLAGILLLLYFAEARDRNVLLLILLPALLLFLLGYST